MYKCLKKEQKSELNLSLSAPRPNKSLEGVDDSTRVLTDWSLCVYWFIAYCNFTVNPVWGLRQYTFIIPSNKHVLCHVLKSVVHHPGCHQHCVPMNLSNIWNNLFFNFTNLSFCVALIDWNSVLVNNNLGLLIIDFFFFLIVVWEKKKLVFCNQWDNGVHYIFTFSEQKSLSSLIVFLLGRTFCLFFAKGEGGTKGLGIELIQDCN